MQHAQAKAQRMATLTAEEKAERKLQHFRAEAKWEASMNLEEKR